MSKPVYAEVGESLQQIGGTCPDGWIVMQGERPEPEYVAQADGSWGAPAPSVPEQVSRAQGKVVLITAGLWPDVLAYVDSMTDPTEKELVEVALNDTTHWRRDSPTMQAIATALDIPSEQMDDLFIRASKINL